VARAAALLELPLYMRAHNIEAERFRTMGKPWWPGMLVLERYAMKKSNGVFFVTPEDKEMAKAYYGIPEAHCHIAPFGTTLEKVPEGRAAARTRLEADFELAAGIPVLYFVGVLDYLPNYQAVGYIVREVIPRLRARGLQFEVIIAGKGLPQELQQAITACPNIRYAGFVPDLETFLLGSDVMLNPVLTGGGIKTKVVEALAYGKTVVSTTIGAAGLEPTACGDNLLLAADHNWEQFTDNIIKAIEKPSQTPAAFFDKYYWGNIAGDVLSTICPSGGI